MKFLYKHMSSRPAGGGGAQANSVNILINSEIHMCMYLLIFGDYNMRKQIFQIGADFKKIY